jgi:DNA-directed RNA polymerase specialized sigma54-like protein
MKEFNGVKVFSATLARNREELGEKVTQWIRDNPAIEITDIQVKQSSDREFHCISIVVFYYESIP